MKEALNHISFALNLLAIGFGLFSARFWYRSAQVVIPRTAYDGGKAQGEVWSTSSRLNGRGALMAALSMMCLAFKELIQVLAERL
jgi:hypothetical protein